MFAVFKTGGKQYKVATDDVITVETLPGDAGSEVKFHDVLMIGGDGKAPSVGAPLLAKAAVFAEVMEQSRGPKIIVFKKRRRTGYRRKNGHRQNQTVLRITGISATGDKPAARKPAAKKTAAMEPAAIGPWDKKPAAKKTAAKKPAAKKPAAKKTAAEKPAAKTEE
ncbi:MAG: 50S ribosomal protein L21 [Rhodospirillales bacterium]